MKNGLDEILKNHPVPSLRFAAWSLAALIAAAIGWGAIAQLDEVAIARGEVIPQTRVKVVQHLEGGIVQSLAVQEGKVVKSGDLLLTLELAPTAMNRDELQVRLDASTLNRARLEAESTNKAPVFPAEESRRRPELLRAERDAYESRRREFTAAIGSLQDQVRQREQLLRELEAGRASKSSELAVARERQRLGQQLLKDDLIPRLEFLQMQRDSERANGDLQAIVQQIPRAQSAVAEMRSRITEEENKFQRVALEELGKVEQTIQRTRELLADAVGQRVRTEIKSPSDGIVKNVKYTTIGGVVRPGDPILEIVPVDDVMVVEAKLNPVDRGYVRAGQRAVVKVTAYDYVRYGGLEGKVALIAADSNTEQNGNVFFRVVIETEKSWLGDKQGDWPVVAGMQASVDIHTGARSVLDYLVRPVLKLKHEAFRER